MFGVARDIPADVLDGALEPDDGGAGVEDGQFEGDDGERPWVEDDAVAAAAHGELDIVGGDEDMDADEAAEIAALLARFSTQKQQQQAEQQQKTTQAVTDQSSSAALSSSAEDRSSGYGAHGAAAGAVGATSSVPAAGGQHAFNNHLIYSDTIDPAQQQQGSSGGPQAAAAHPVWGAPASAGVGPPSQQPLAQPPQSGHGMPQQPMQGFPSVASPHQRPPLPGQPGGPPQVGFAPGMQLPPGVSPEQFARHMQQQQQAFMAAMAAGMPPPPQLLAAMQAGPQMMAPPAQQQLPQPGQHPGGPQQQPAPRALAPAEASFLAQLAGGTGGGGGSAPPEQQQQPRGPPSAVLKREPGHQSPQQHQQQGRDGPIYETPQKEQQHPRNQRGGGGNSTWGNRSGGNGMQQSPGGRQQRQGVPHPSPKGSVQYDRVEYRQRWQQGRARMRAGDIEAMIRLTEQQLFQGNLYVEDYYFQVWKKQRDEKEFQERFGGESSAAEDQENVVPAVFGRLHKPLFESARWRDNKKDAAAKKAASATDDSPDKMGSSDEGESQAAAEDDGADGAAEVEPQGGRGNRKRQTRGRGGKNTAKNGGGADSEDQPSEGGGKGGKKGGKAGGKKNNKKKQKKETEEKQAIETVLGRFSLSSARNPRPLLQITRPRRGSSNAPKPDEVSEPAAAADGATTGAEGAEDAQQRPKEHIKKKAAKTARGRINTLSEALDDNEKLDHLRYGPLLRIEAAFNIILEIEDIDMLLERTRRSEDDAQRVDVGTLEENREKMVSSLFSDTLCVHVTPFSDLPQRADDRIFLFPEDESFISLLLLRKGRALVARLMPLMTPSQILSVFFACLRNAALLTMQVTAQQQGSAKDPLFEVLSLVVRGGGAPHTILALQTLLAAHADEHVVAVLQTQPGAYLVQSILKKGHDLTLSPFSREDPALDQLPAEVRAEREGVGGPWRDTLQSLMQRMSGSWRGLFPDEPSEIPPRLWEFQAVLVVNLNPARRIEVLSELQEVIQAAPESPILSAFLQLAGVTR